MKMCKIRLIMTLEELTGITLDTMTTVLRNFPFDYFTLKLKYPRPDMIEELLEE